MKIVKLEAQNVKRLKAVEITPQGNTVVIGGRNAQGKTSVLDSICYALGGQGAVCERPVRDGQEKAKVVCQLDDMIVTRTFTADGGGTLTVSNADGTARFASPQKMLDALVGRLTFDPLGFLHMKPAEQLATLKELVGLDFSELDRDRKLCYEQRTFVNRDIKQQEGVLVSLPEYPNVPDQEVSLTALAGELQKANQHNNEIEQAYEQVEDAKARQQAIWQNAESIQGKIEYLMEEKQRYEQEARSCDEQISMLEEKASLLKPIDTSAIQGRMAEADEVNQRVRHNRARVNVVKRLEELREESQKYTGEIERIDQAKASAIASANLPIEGLAFGEDGVTFGGIPFEQCSSAEQLRVSVAMGLAANPKLKVLLVRDGSLLDSESMALLQEMVAEADAQLWLEVVSKDGEGCSVVIEDGEARQIGTVVNETH